jgi:iron(III) transport system permease protein
MTATLPGPTSRPSLQEVVRGLSAWPARIVGFTREAAFGWTAMVAVLFAVMALPIATVLVLAFAPRESIWPHLVATILPSSLAATLVLMAGTGLLTIAIGTGTAWLVTMYRFPHRGLIDQLLVIPLAMPTYIVAYCYVELLDYAGPVQSALRGLFGWRSARDYWFPDPRSLAGAVFVFAAVLYPYVYLTARASFVQQSVCALEVARTLGRTSTGAFWEVALPLARPAIVAGVALVLMECLNDLGAVQYLGVTTLTASIYATWLQRSNLGGAAQLSAIMLVFIAALFAAERAARGGALSHHTSRRYRSIPFQDLEGWRGHAAAVLCALPFVIGFLIPFGVLVRHALVHATRDTLGVFLSAAWSSLLLASLTALAAILIALALAYARRVVANRLTRSAVRFAGLGYAIPGTVLAVGLLIPLAQFDNRVDGLMRSTFGISTGLLLSGSLFALMLAYVIRFLAVALGSIEAGFERISPNLDAAARASARARCRRSGACNCRCSCRRSGRRGCWCSSTR